MQEGTNIKGSTKTLRHQGNLNSTPNDLPVSIAPKRDISGNFTRKGSKIKRSFRRSRGVRVSI